jgi:hypothetical protein
MTLDLSMCGEPRKLAKPSVWVIWVVLTYDALTTLIYKFRRGTADPGWICFPILTCLQNLQQVPSGRLSKQRTNTWVIIWASGRLTPSS